jgi:hypothetical protein
VILTRDVYFDDFFYTYQPSSLIMSSSTCDITSPFNSMLAYASHDIVFVLDSCNSYEYTK